MPDGDGVENSGFSEFDREPESPNQMQERMFRETAKRFAQEQEEVSTLAQEYRALYPNQPPLPDNMSVLGGPTKSGPLLANVMTWPQGEKNKISRLFHQQNPKARELLGRFSPVETDISLSLDGVYTDEATMEQYFGLLKDNPLFESKVKTYYYFDDKGNYFKWCDIPEQIDTDESRYIQQPYFGEKHVVSDMTAHDFELTGQLLHGMKSALSTSLGKTPGPQG